MISPIMPLACRIAVGVLLCSLAACGGSGSTPGSPATATAPPPSTPTASPSAVDSATATPAPPTLTPSPIATASATASATATSTASHTPEATGTDTPSPTPTHTPTPTPTLDPCEEPGTICTVAGTGLTQFDGDGRPALETSFYYPLDVDFDVDDRPLILDWNNLRLRRLETDGTIRTVMGNAFEGFPVDGAPASETSLHHPTDIEQDGEGNLYVAGNHVPVVFRVDTENLVFIVAGTTEFGNEGNGGPARDAKLSEPYGVLPDGHGGFYVSDASAHVIRHVDGEGIIRAFAGTGARGYAGDGGDAVLAQLDSPTRLQLDDVGDLFFCDTDNHVIRRVRGGEITTVAGTGEAGYAGDGGPASQARLQAPHDLRFSPAGDLYVADTGNNVVRRIDLEGNITTVVGTGDLGFAGDLGEARDARLNRPSGIRFGADGSLWIADTFNQRVRRVARFLEVEGGTPGPTRTRRPTSPPTVTPTASPTGAPPEDVLETVAGSGRAGFGGDGGAATAADLDSPVEVLVRPSGEVVVVDFGNHRLRAIDPEDGTIRTIAGNGETVGEGALPFPTDVVFSEDGSFIVAAWGGNQLFQYFTNGSRRLIAGDGQPVCGGEEVADPTTLSLRLPRGIEQPRSGGLLVSEQGCHRIRRLTPSALSTYAGTGQAGYAGDGGPPAAAQFSSRTSPLRPMPNFGIALSPESIADELYVADTANHVVREIRLLTDRIDTFAGTGLAGFRDGTPRQSQFDRPTAVFVTSDHALWVSDSGNHAIRRIDPLAVGVETIAGTGAPGYDGEGRSARASRLDNPGGLFVTSGGDVYVADTGNHRVRRFRFRGRF